MQSRLSQAIKLALINISLREMRTGITVITLTCCLCFFYVVTAAPIHDPEKRAAELESVRTQIKDVETNIQAARNEADLIYKELQASEIITADISEKLQEIDNSIDEKVKKLAELKVEKSSNRKFLEQQRVLLSKQIQAAYKIGRNDFLKLILNQEDPAFVGRMLVYYDYHNRARVQRIDEVTKALEKISSLEHSIQVETDQLDHLRAEQLRKLEEFTQHRNARKNIIARLHAYIDEQGKQLHVLQRNALELEKLVKSLKEKESIVSKFENIPPFNSLKGKLAWPAKGKITSNFGALRKGGKLKWQGVTIAADNGTEVRAVSTGKVIFADWFRNMGLLIILDHGDEYMTLYGHNEQLLKKVGDWVIAGEIIARVGDTGGQQQPNLYFEIRRSGDPINPGLWCKI